MLFPSSNNTSHSHLSLKLALISTSILSIAILLKLSFPSLTRFITSEFPTIYTSALSWLRPPYLYLIINGIIISIVASSKLHFQKDKQQFKQSEITLPQATVIVETKRSDDLLTEVIDEAVLGGNLYEDCSASKGNLEKENVKISDGNDLDLCKSVKGTNSIKNPLRSESLDLLFEKFENEKPLLSARFAHKKSLKANSNEASKATGLGVTKPKRNDTLENTWKMITDGRAMPLTRHLKKSDTWETHSRRDKTETKPPCPPLPEKTTKSETFSERRSKLSHKINRQPSGKLKKEPSLSQDELNRRVEAFIKKFNEEMRLQRQESLNQFQEMINRGV